MSKVRPKIAKPVEDADLLKGTRPRDSKERVLDIPVSALRDYVKEKLAKEYVPLGRRITINGVTYDLSEDRAWSISGSSGIDGANSRRWFALNTTKDPLTTGFITLRDGVAPFYPVTFTPASVARVVLNVSDNTGASMVAWLAALRAHATSYTGKAYIQITDASNNSIFGIYRVDSAVPGASFYSYYVTYISGNGPFVLDSEVVVSWVLFGADGSSGGSGTVTSVGLSAPSPASPAFSVSGSPVTTSGTLAINALGSTSQYIRGDGSLATFPTTPTPIPDVAIYPYQQAVMIIDSSPLTLSAFPNINAVAAPSYGVGNVKLFDAITNELLTTFFVPGAVAAFHIPSINEIWISTLSATTIRRYDDSTFSFIATFANGGNRATEAVIDPVSGYVYTTNLSSNSISVIDPTGPSVVTTFTSGIIGGTSPKGICYNNNPASAMYQMIVAVLSGTNELCVIDPSTNTVTAININPSGSLSGAQSIAYSETSDQYYVACSVGKNVVVLEPLTATTMGLVTSIQGIINAYDIECDQDTGLLYVSFARIQASVVVSHVLLGVIDSSLNRLVRVCNTASINTSTTVVYNVAVDSVNGVAYCNGYLGSNLNKFLSKFKIKP